MNKYENSVGLSTLENASSRFATQEKGITIRNPYTNNNKKKRSQSTTSGDKTTRYHTHGENKHINSTAVWPYYLFILSMVQGFSAFSSERPRSRLETQTDHIYTSRLSSGISSGDAVSPSASCLVGLLELMA